MWLAFNDGFLSVVAHRDKPGLLLVRARRRAHLAAAFPHRVIRATPDADYAYRTEVTRGELTALLAERVAGIDYDNFKDSVADRQLHDAYLHVWHDMRAIQPAPRGGRPKRRA